METLLFVDDSPSIRHVCKLELEKEGYCVIVAEDGHDAIEALGQHEISLVILDMKMRRMGGFEAIGRIRDQRPGLPIVAHTTLSEPEVLSQGDVAPDAHVPKDGNISRLKRVVASLLAARRSAAQGEGAGPSAHRLFRLDEPRDALKRCGKGRGPPRRDRRTDA